MTDDGTDTRREPESEGGFDRIADRISRFPEVDSVFLMSGGFDLLLFIKGRTMHESFSFVSEKLATMPLLRDSRAFDSSRE